MRKTGKTGALAAGAEGSQSRPRTVIEQNLINVLRDNPVICFAIWDRTDGAKRRDAMLRIGVNWGELLSYFVQATVRTIVKYK